MCSHSSTLRSLVVTITTFIQSTCPSISVWNCAAHTLYSVVKYRLFSTSAECRYSIARRRKWNSLERRLYPIYINSDQHSDREHTSRTPIQRSPFISHGQQSTYTTHTFVVCNIKNKTKQQYPPFTQYSR